MNRILNTLVIVAGLTFGNLVSAKEQLVTITHENPQTLQRAFVWLHSHLHSGSPSEGFQASLNDSQRQLLLDKGFQVSLVKTQRNTATSTMQNTSGIEDFACYETLSESQQILAQIAEEYPNLTELISIGDSERKVNVGLGHELQVIKLTKDNDLVDKPILFMHAAMHAREYATAPVTLAFIQHMLNGYGSDSDITWILEQHEIHVLLFMNPDGREKAETGLSWRKNTNDAYCTEDDELHGADLNRNFTYSWSKNSQGASTEECEITYRGPLPASEPETQAVEAYLKSIFEDRRGPLDSDKAPDDVTGMHIDVHSYGELVLWPWAHTEDAAPNGVELEQIARKVAYFNDYRPIQAVGLYPTTGSSESISYGELGIPQLTIELGTDFFQDCATYEADIKQQNIEAFKYAARIVGAPYQFSMGAELTDIEINGVGDPYLSNAQHSVVVFNASDEHLKQDAEVESDKDVSAIRFAINEFPYDEQATVYTSEFIGNADSGDARVWGEFSTDGLAEGQHQLFAQAQSSDGHWGPVYSSFFDVAQMASTGRAPVVDFDLVCSGLICNLDGSKSFDLDDDIVEMKWLLSIGEYEEFGANARYTFRNSGEFPVELVVTDSLGNQGRLKKTAVVNNQFIAPQVEIDTVCQELTCQFSARVLEGENLSFEWQIGEETYVDVSSITHEFALEGEFFVELTTRDGFGRQVTTQQEIDVVLSSSLRFAPEIVCSNMLCEFQLNSIDERFTESGWQINTSSYAASEQISIEVNDENIEWRVFALTEFGHEVSHSGTILRSDLVNRFGVTWQSDCSELQCDFDVTDVPSVFSSARWQWPDGQTSEGVSVSKSFDGQGSYEIVVVLLGDILNYQFSVVLEVTEQSNSNADGDSSDGGADQNSGGSVNTQWLLVIFALICIRRFIRLNIRLRP